MTYEEDEEDSVNDSIVEENVDFLRSRSTVGERKYGVTLDRTDINLIEWMQHLREELADALNYVTRVQRELTDTQHNTKKD